VKEKERKIGRTGYGMGEKGFSPLAEMDLPSVLFGIHFCVFAAVVLFCIRPRGGNAHPVVLSDKSDLANLEATFSHA